MAKSFSPLQKIIHPGTTESHVLIKALGVGNCGTGQPGTRGRQTREKTNEGFDTANTLLTKNATGKCAYCLQSYDHEDCKTVRSTQECKNVLQGCCFPWFKGCKAEVVFNTIGANQAEVKVRDVVDVDLFPLRGSKSGRFQCYVVDDIATIPNERVDIVKVAEQEKFHKKNFFLVFTYLQLWSFHNM